MNNAVIVCYLTIITFAHSPTFAMFNPWQCLPTTDYLLTDNFVNRSDHDWETLYKTHKNELTNPNASGKKLQKLWHNVNVPNKPKKFLLGVSSSAYQIEGGLDKNNATAAFYQSKGLTTAMDAIDFWNRYKNDIQQMKTELGINSFRLSIAWERVEPEQGKYDENAIDTYIDIMKTLKEYDIEPVVVLHHYTIPTWFARNNGFEKKENINDFVTFAEKMYQALYQYVTYWSTFNAPEAYALKGYAKGDAAPGYVGKWQQVEEVLSNMLEAHVQIYQSIKSTTGLYNFLRLSDKSIPMPLIGIQKNIVLLDSSHENFLHTCLSPISAACCTAGNILQSEGFYSFFTTGTFYVNIPFQAYVSHTNTLAPQSLDWIGLNFYSNMKMFITKPQTELNEKRKTKNPTYRDYPEGIARAVQEIYSKIAQPLNIPLLITENGIATENNMLGEKKRTKFFYRTLFTITALIEDGYNIIGYLPWSSHDSYEWPTKEFIQAFGGRRYGFFNVNFTKNKKSKNYLKRTLKQSSHYYRDFIKSYNSH